MDNRDTIIEDHVTYSVNRDQVVSRIVDEMFRSVELKDNPYYRDKCQRRIDCKERRNRVAQLAGLRMIMYSLILSIFGFFVWASIVNATPTTSMLNGLTTIPVIKHTFGQTMKLLYRVPSREDGSITFVSGMRTVLQDGTPKLEPDTSSFVVAVTDRNDEAQIVPRNMDRIQERKGDSEWTYTTDESDLRTGIGNLVVWSPGFKHFVIPALFAILVGIGLLVLFRIYRDIVWKHFYERCQKKRHEDYKEWREDQP